MLARIDLAGPQVGHQKLIAAKNIQRQKTVMIIITVEKTSLLEPVHRIVGGVKVQDDLFGFLGKGSDELFDQQLVQGKGCPPILPVFKNDTKVGALANASVRPVTVCNKGSRRRVSKSFKSS